MAKREPKVVDLPLHPGGQERAEARSTQNLTPTWRALGPSNSLYPGLYKGILGIDLGLD